MNSNNYLYYEKIQSSIMQIFYNNLLIQKKDDIVSMFNFINHHLF